jgi:hypothetical protein
MFGVRLQEYNGRDTGVLLVSLLKRNRRRGMIKPLDVEIKIEDRIYVWNGASTITVLEYDPRFTDHNQCDKFSVWSIKDWASSMEAILDYHWTHHWQ